MNLGELIEKNFVLPLRINSKPENFKIRKRLEGTKKLKDKIFSGIYFISKQRILKEQKYEKLLMETSLIKNHEEFQGLYGKNEKLEFFENGKTKYLSIFVFPSMGDMRYRIEIEDKKL